MAAVPEWLKGVIDDYSMDRFHVESHGYKYNHTVMGLVALWQLGGTERHLRRYADLYSREQLEPARVRPSDTLPSPQLLSAELLQGLLGERKQFLRLAAHFRQRLSDLGGDLDLLIQEEFPAVLAGLGASAVHGLIQIGYACYLRDDRLVSEALAYLHFGYLPQNVSSPDDLVTCLGSGDTDFIDVLRGVKQDGRLLSYMHQHLMPFEDDRHRSVLLRRIHTLLLEKGDDLVQLVGTIRLPAWYNNHLDTLQVRRIGNWILDEAIRIFTYSGVQNNLFLLHNVTGAWALRQVLPLLPDRTEVSRAVSYMLSAMIAVYIIEECPTLREEYLTAVVPDTWEAITHRNLELDADPHVYKLVHICLQRHRELNLGGRDLGGGDLGGGDLGGADLGGADLGGADLGDNLGGGDLRDDLKGGDLGVGELEVNDLGGGDLRVSDLGISDLEVREMCHKAAHISTFYDMTRICPT